MNKANTTFRCLNDILWSNQYLTNNNEKNIINKVGCETEWDKRNKKSASGLKENKMKLTYIEYGISTVRIARNRWPYGGENVREKDGQIK